MIERLNQLPLYDFIELSCGNNSVLLLGDSNVTDAELKERASKLIIEYRKVADPVRVKALLVEREDLVKEKVKILLLRVCQNLLSLSCCDEVREVLAIMSYKSSHMTDEQVSVKVEELLRSVLFEQKRNEDLKTEEKSENLLPEQIRASFDSEIAFLMTYFKMNIDVRSTNAAIYANIVHQADVEISAKRRK